MRRLATLLLLILLVLAPTGAFGGHNDLNRVLVHTELSADVTIDPAGTVATIFTVPVNLPTRQGPWRAHAEYNVLIGTGANTAACQVWLDDQQASNNVFGGSHTFITSNNNDAASAGGYSKNTYSNATRITFLVKVQCFGSVVTVFTNLGASSTVKTRLDLVLQPD